LLGGALGSPLLGGGLLGGGLLYGRQLGLALGLFPRRLGFGLTLVFPLGSALGSGGLFGGGCLRSGLLGLALGPLGGGLRGDLTLCGRWLSLQVGLLHHLLHHRLGCRRGIGSSGFLGGLRLGGLRLGGLRLGGLRLGGLAGELCLALLLVLDGPLKVGVQRVQVVLSLSLGLGGVLFVIQRLLDCLGPARLLGLKLALALLQIVLGLENSLIRGPLLI
jgi:hypothetical protein